jgi:large subunit ribosomal protein L21
MAPVQLRKHSLILVLRLDKSISGQGKQLGPALALPSELMVFFRTASCSRRAIAVPTFARSLGTSAPRRNAAVEAHAEPLQTPSSAPRPPTPSASTSSSFSPAPSPLSTSRALALLRSQPSHYIIAQLHNRKILLTPRDLLTTERLKDVNVGDVIRFTRILELGSRDYTIRDPKGIAPSVVKCEATVVEHTKGKLETLVKTKRRKGYKKTIRQKQPYTRLRIGDIVLGEP